MLRAGYLLKKVNYYTIVVFQLPLVTGKQGPQRDFSQFNFRNSEPKIEGDDSSSVGMFSHVTSCDT